MWMNGVVFSKKHKRILDREKNDYLMARQLGIHQVIWMCGNNSDILVDENGRKYHIHHIDGNKQNNRLDNLCLIKQSEHEQLHKKGKNISENIKSKISESLKKLYQENLFPKYEKPILMLDEISEEIICEFNSSIQAENILGINHSNIIKCCKGKRKTCGGFKWKYK